MLKQASIKVDEVAKAERRIGAVLEELEQEASSEVKDVDLEKVVDTDPETEGLKYTKPWTMMLSLARNANGSSSGVQDIAIALLRAEGEKEFRVWNHHLHGDLGGGSGIELPFLCKTSPVAKEQVIVVGSITIGGAGEGVRPPTALSERVARFFPLRTHRVVASAGHSLLQRHSACSPKPYWTWS